MVVMETIYTGMRVDTLANGIEGVNLNHVVTFIMIPLSYLNE